MPYLAREESMRQLMTIIMLLSVCLIGLIIMKSLDGSLPQSSTKRRKTSDQAKSPPPINQNISHIRSLPVELLMHIFEYLAPNNVQPHLDSAFFHAYKQSQKDLRSVCLVSKLMDAVARPYLYRAAIVNNVDVLAYLLRTLDEVQGLREHVKRLVLEVTFTLEDGHYRKPDVAILASRPSYSHICHAAAEYSDVTRYEKYLVRLRRLGLGGNLDAPSLTFREWAWEGECKILGSMHFELLRRTNNISSLCFGMICSASPHFVFPYASFLGKVRRTMAGQEGVDAGHPFMPKLLKLQVLGSNADGQGPYSASFLQPFLEIPSLRALQALHDDGGWFDLDPHPRFDLPKLTKSVQPSSYQYKNITRIDLKRSHCTPQAIYQICSTFPALEHLVISTDYDTSGRNHRIDGFGSQGKYLSTALAKLEHLKELVLNLHYSHGVKAVLGQHGVLNLAGLIELVKVRLPLHFFVEMQPGKDPFVTDPGQVLPPSVKHLTVWADMGSVRSWGVTGWFPNHPRAGPPYHPRQSALDFLDSVSFRVTDHFKDLKEITYCYRDQALSTTCRCDIDEPCSRCEASQLLYPYREEDSSAQMQILSSRFGDHRVRLIALQEEAED